MNISSKTFHDIEPVSRRLTFSHGLPSHGDGVIVGDTKYVILMATNCCHCVRSIWMNAVRFIVSDEEGIRRKRRLVWGIIVLLLVDVIWVGSSELTDVRNFSLLMNK